MTKLLFPAFMVVPLAAFSLLAVAGPSPDGDCAAQFESLNAEWRTLWPAWPTLKPGRDALVANRLGHSYTVTEYTFMHRRLDRSRRLCRDGNVGEAATEMWIVRSWLADDNERESP